MIQYHVTVTSEWHHSDVTVASLFRHTRITNKKLNRAVCQQNRNLESRHPDIIACNDYSLRWADCGQKKFQIDPITIPCSDARVTSLWCHSDVTVTSYRIIITWSESLGRHTSIWECHTDYLRYLLTYAMQTSSVHDWAHNSNFWAMGFKLFMMFT